MKPGLLNYVLAYSLAITSNVGGIAGASVCAVNCWPNFGAPYDPWLIARTLLAIAACYALGMFFLPVLLAPPLLAFARKVNGAPFAVGDRVMILIGPRRGAVGNVYELWNSRGSLRVFLGEEEKQKVTDVFDNHKVWRCPK